MVIANMRRVYVAGPVGPMEGRAERVVAAITVGEQISAIGLSPFVPHLYFFWDSRHRHDYEFWMTHCITWVRQCEALFRMPGASPGADREEALAVSLGLPVFRDLKLLDRWARGEHQPAADQDRPLGPGDVVEYEVATGFWRRATIRSVHLCHLFKPEGERAFSLEWERGYAEALESEVRRP